MSSIGFAVAAVVGLASVVAEASPAAELAFLGPALAPLQPAVFVRVVGQHRGIAARQFQRAFLLAEGMQVLGADLVNGLLSIDLVRPEPERIDKKIDISARD